MIKLNAFQLKIIALVMMLMDHLYLYFPSVFSVWFQPLSRFVAPLFAFLVAEGFFHTRNRIQYQIRMWTSAGIMFLGNSLLNNLLFHRVFIKNNIFLTLAIGLSLLYFIETIRKCGTLKKMAWMGAAFILAIIGLFFSEGGLVEIPVMLITYFFRKHKGMLVTGYLLLFVVLFRGWLVPGLPPEVITNHMVFRTDALFITVIPFILMYNGERGRNDTLTKYLFYVFYPLHIWGIALISYF